jgi:hypothetical protein
MRAASVSTSNGFPMNASMFSSMLCLSVSLSSFAVSRIMGTMDRLGISRI